MKNISIVIVIKLMISTTFLCSGEGKVPGWNPKARAAVEKTARTTISFNSKNQGQLTSMLVNWLSYCCCHCLSLFEWITTRAAFITRYESPTRIQFTIGSMGADWAVSRLFAYFHWNDDGRVIVSIKLKSRFSTLRCDYSSLLNP